MGENALTLSKWLHSSDHLWEREIVGQNIYGVLVYETTCGRDTYWRILFNDDVLSEVHQGEHQTAELAMAAADERLTSEWGEGWLQQMPGAMK